MRRFAICLFVCCVLSLACNINATKTPDAGDQTPTATNTQETAAPPTATDTQAPPTATDTPAPPPPNVTCGPLSLYLDPSLGTSYGCETIPEANDADLPAFGINPQYSKITLAGYPLTDRFMDPHIDIFPVQRFRELLPDLVNPRVAALQALIGDGTPGSEAFPILPIFNAAQMFYAQYAVVPFQNGSGARYITMYGQAYYPVSNHDMFLSYQGLSTDGQYWISMILPISHPSLPVNGDNPPGGDWDAFYANPDPYFTQVTIDLNAQPAASFSPSIVQVDALIQSMIIQP